MQIDYNQLNQGGHLDRLLSVLPYPLAKDEIVAYAQQEGANPQLITALAQILPNEEFTSAEEIKNRIPRGASVRY